MKNFSLQACVHILRGSIILLILILISLLLFSFTMHRFNDEFLRQLGMSKPAAEEKITNSILEGYLDAYGARNAKNIALGKRAAVVTDLLTYTRGHVQTPAFKKAYAALKESHKPQPATVQTPEEMRAGMISEYKKSIASTEQSLKEADATMKPVFENVLQEAKKQLKATEDPNNKMILAYSKNYPGLKKSTDEQNQQRLQEWEKLYPGDHMQFVKTRLQQFMQETDGIDFDAALTMKNGKKIFVSPQYEGKSYRWKMAFRAGREVVEQARALVHQWINDIK